MYPAPFGIMLWIWPVPLGVGNQERLLKLRTNFDWELGHAARSHFWPSEGLGPYCVDAIMSAPTIFKVWPWQL